VRIDRILTEFVIFARERGGDDEAQIGHVIKAAERHLYRLQWIRKQRARTVLHKPFCERCDGPSSSGILCWACLDVAPASIRHAMRDAIGLEGMRAAAAKVRIWIRTSTQQPNESRRHAA
jgi:hypothetical protein